VQTPSEFTTFLHGESTQESVSAARKGTLSLIGWAGLCDPCSEGVL